MKSLINRLVITGYLLIHDANVIWTWAQEEDIRDVRGPIDYPLHPGWYILGSGIGLIALFFLVRWGIKYNQARLAALREMEKLPWEIAYDRLEELRRSDLLANDEFQIFNEKLADILRRYIESQFAIRAVEMTTDEFLLSLRDNKDLTLKHKELLKKYLQFADMVKFAKYSPTQKASHEGFDIVKAFVTETHGE